MRQVEAARLVRAPPKRVFDFLSDLRNHWRLEHGFVELGALEGAGAHGPTGGRVRIKGPLGLSRVARTRVLGAEPPEKERAGSLHGRADVGRRTVGVVRWTIEPAGEGSTVTLAATVQQASVLDRLLLLAGGSWRLRRPSRARFAS